MKHNFPCRPIAVIDEFRFVSRASNGVINVNGLVWFSKMQLKGNRTWRKFGGWRFACPLAAF
jgi:hypothetical protein